MQPIMQPVSQGSPPPRLLNTDRIGMNNESNDGCKVTKIYDKDAGAGATELEPGT